MARRLMSHSTPYGGDGPSSGREEGTKEEDKESFVSWRGKRGAQPCEYGQCKSGDVHVKTASRGCVGQ